jgi:hypothetical protein
VQLGLLMPFAEPLTVQNSTAPRESPGLGLLVPQGIGIRNPDSARRAALDMTRRRRRTSNLFEQITHVFLDHSRLR